MAPVLVSSGKSNLSSAFGTVGSWILRRGAPIRFPIRAGDTERLRFMCPEREFENKQTPRNDGLLWLYEEGVALDVLFSPDDFPEVEVCLLVSEDSTFLLVSEDSAFLLESDDALVPLDLLSRSCFSPPDPRP